MQYVVAMYRVIVILGPTASGKSALAVSLAKKFNGEVISADSRQIYRGLEIGSGAITKKEMRGIPHHLLAVASPIRAFTTAQFVRRARRAITEIAARKHIPIITGGTAFWIDALVHDLSLPAVKPDFALRRRLGKKSPARLLVMLKKLDPRRAAEIEQKNPRRLIRAIEIARTLGHVPRLKRRSAYNALWIGLKPSDTRSQKIWKHAMEQRVRAIIRAGLIQETKILLRRGVSKKRIREFGFEYAAALDVISRATPRSELEPRIIRDTARYRRRQMRWWRRNHDIHWISAPTKAESLARTFAQRNS